MAWTNDIDPTEPQDSDSAALGDDEIRTLKSALAERFGSIFFNWPAEDPLLLAATKVGLLSARPATPSIEGELYFATDNSTWYIAVAAAWVAFSASGKLPPWPNIQTIAAPTGVVVTDSSSCAVDVPTYEIDLLWVNGDATLQTLIIVDGVLIATAAAGATTSNDLAPATLVATRYSLITIMHYDPVNIQVGLPHHYVWLPPNPCAASSSVSPLANFTTVDSSLTGPDYNVDLAVSRITPSQHVDIYHDGVLIYTLAPGSDTWTHGTPTGLDMNVYTAVPREGAVDGPPMTRAIFLPNPDAGGLTPPASVQATGRSSDCETTPIYEVRITWTNTETEETRIYAREGTDAFVLRATLAAGITLWDWLGPPFVLDEQWEFKATHWNDPTESPDSNVAAWIASCEE